MWVARVLKRWAVTAPWLDTGIVPLPVVDTPGALKLTKLPEGTGPPAAPTRRYPTDSGSITVTDAVTAVASSGTLHDARTDRVRVPWAGMAPPAVRVSTTRQGDRGTKWAVAGSGVVVAGT